MSVTSITSTGPAKTLPPGRYGLPCLLRSEWTKLRSVRSTMWTLGLTLVIGVAVSVIGTAATRANWSSMSRASRTGFDPIGTSLWGIVSGQLTIGILGVLAMSAEYGTGTIRATFAAAPRRRLVLAAKAAVFGLVALVVSEIVAFASFLVGQALLSAPATHATLSTPGAWRAVIGSGLFLCLIGLFSLGLATIIRHTAGAISAFVAILLVLPRALPASLNHAVVGFLPSQIGANMASGTPLDYSFAPWIGLAVLAGYTVALLVIGANLLVKRDA
jgi:hypothetical protein